MTKMPEPTHTLINAREHLNQDGKIYIKYISEESVKQYGRDLLESAAVEMQGLYTYGGDDVAAVIRAMKEQIK
jgi:hypothetical protein